MKQTDTVVNKINSLNQTNTDVDKINSLNQTNTDVDKINSLQQTNTDVGKITSTEKLLQMSRPPSLRKRFSSIEPRSPTTPNGNEQQQIYTVPDFDDNVFSDEKEVPKPEVPPTPGTAASLHGAKGWSKRKLGVRDFVLIAVFIAVIVALAVGIALIIIFVSDDSSSSSSSSSQLGSTAAPGTTSISSQDSSSSSSSSSQLGSTAAPGTTSISSQVTTVTQETTQETTTVLSQDIHYDGHLNLSSPWKAPLVELEDLFQHDMEAIIAGSPLYKYFIKSSLFSVRADEELLFTLDFKSSLAESVSKVEEVEDNSLARTVQNILRKQVVTNIGIKLPIKVDTIVILENIPVTPATSASTTSVPSSTETETEGPCLSLTFEPCHSLLESSTFYVPNILHHKTALEAEDAYRELSGPVVNTSCSDFALFYLCALLFPSCDNNRVPLHPCDTLCQVVKNDCGILNGWPQNCNDLPSSNCRVAAFTTTPEPTTMLPTTATASTVTLPTVISATTTALQATTTEPTKTAIQTEFQCAPFNFSMCNAFGLNETVLPSVVFQCYDIQCLIEKFNHFVEQSIANGCTNDLTFFCAYTFRGCNKDNMLDAIGPCFESCIDAVDHCGKFMPHRPECSQFKPSPKPCIPSQPSPPFQCLNQTYSYCASEGFTKTETETTEEDIKAFEDWSLSTITSGCSDVAKFFYCGMFFPQCEETSDAPGIILPCRKYCDEVTAQCPNATFDVDCLHLNEDDECARPQTTTSTASPTSTSTTEMSTETVEYPCYDQTYSYCASEGFTRIDTDMLEELIKDFEKWSLPVIQSRCSDLARFFYCGIFFPQCEDEYTLMPCRKYCEEVMAKCPNTTFRYDCQSLNDDDCSKPLFNTSTSQSMSASTVPTTTVLTTTPKPHCEPLKFEPCLHFGYTQTSFPNLWGDKTAEEANRSYYSGVERSVAAGCSPNVLFYVCSLLFPSCEGDGIIRMPCTSVCEEVNSSCPLIFQQDCDVHSSPELNCSAPPVRITCETSEFACSHINRCVPLTAVCNKANDCGDWSDEKNCVCDPQFEIKCAMGLCIPSYFRCDGTANCPDHSDEGNCECKSNQFKCDGGPCIMSEWLCDGQKDCPKNDDEDYCHNCSKTEFACVDYSCIPKAQECDGTPQCSDHTDEMKCISKYQPNSAFYMKVDDEAVETCAEGFTEAHGDIVCRKMGEESLKRWTSLPGHGVVFFQLDPNGDLMTIIGKGKSVKKCTGDVVDVECNLKECGHPLETMVSQIINGQNSLPARWPWMVSVRKYNIHECGGAIVHPYFILTAAHCIESSLDTTHMWIVAGTLRLSELGSNGQIKRIRRIIIYPGYRQMEGNDIALLELEEPLKYNDFVKPLCFPETKDVFTRANPCYIAGWGHTKGVKGEVSEHQQETKLTLWDTTKCNSSFMWNGRVKKNEMCAGYYNGLVAACSGDSGSPVVCQDETKTWKVVGVASYVFMTCSVATKPLVYSSVSPYVGWIRNHTVRQFTCNDGIHLFDKGMLCNTVADCKDRSDEIDLCDVRANCSFSDKFLCGYQSKWKLVTNGGDNTVNYFPLFDHTLGNIQGMYLLGNNRGDDLISPRIDLNASHCMRFHYHMRGRVNQGMAISAHNLERKQWVDVWSTVQTKGPDRWLMGTFDLEPGHYDIVFRPHDRRRFALDDIWLIDGKCDKMSCFADEFMCSTSGTKNCLPSAARCNIVVDCDNREDEVNCPASVVYKCDFENGNICALEQHTDDTTISEWIVANSSNTPNKLPDHTFGNASGTLLKVKTEAMLQSDQVFMSQKLQLGNMEHCLSFFYASTSPVTLQVTIEWDNTLQNLIKITNRKTQGWTATQATLPAIGQTNLARLTYAVIGGKLGHWVEEQAIMLDDITITPGSCPTFTCLAGSLLCEGEAYCVSKDKICDRTADCSRGTDESRCVCNTSEFKCSDGLCIPKKQTCDLIKNCLDGSDEGTVCDQKNSVSCDFEDVFLCGYKVNTSQSVFHWERARGKSGDVYTGPSSDHTSIGNSKVAGYYVVAESQYQGNHSSLESVPFVSSGYGLKFFYHAWHILSSGLITGRLSLVATFMNNKTQRLLWSDVPNNEDTWKYMCLDLPVGNITIAFVVQRGSSFRANIALDDLLLLNTTCSMSSTELTDSRITGGVSPTMEPQNHPGCSATQKACRSDMCLPKKLFCDGYSDCPDGSDEFDC